MNGTISFMECGKLKTTFGVGAGTWSLIDYGRMCVTFGKLHHFLVLEHTVGANCQPIFLVQGREMINTVQDMRCSDCDTFGLLQVGPSGVLEPIGTYVWTVDPYCDRCDMSAQTPGLALADGCSWQCQAKREEIGSLWDFSGKREWR